MKAISVRQPWAWAIAAGVKPVENRTWLNRWRSAAGQTLAIHAGNRWDRDGAAFDPLWDAYRERTGLTPPLQDDHPIITGAVIAIVDVIDVHLDRGCCRPWGEYESPNPAAPVVHLALTNVRRLPTPIPCRGALGLFDAPIDLTDLPTTNGAIE